jgi:hypothetical protein
MAEPAIGFLESYFWIFTTIAVSVVSVIAFILYRFWYEPEISRQLTSAKHSNGVPAFVELPTGNVGFYVSNKKMPEGVVHYKHRGWFLLPTHPTPEDEEDMQPEKRGVGKPRKLDPKDKIDLKTGQVIGAKIEDPKLDEAIEQRILHTPILLGFGKQVFFGSDASPMLSNLYTIAHADLRKVRQLAPATMQKTQLDALATGSRLEGIKMAKGETMKFLVMCVGAAIVIGSLGIIAYILTNHGG